MVTFIPETTEGERIVLIALSDLQLRVKYNEPVTKLRETVLWYYGRLAQLPSAANVPPDLVSQFLALARQAGLDLAWPPALPPNR